MTDFIDKLKASTPSATGDKARAIVQEILDMQWVVFASHVHGMDKIQLLIDQYISRYASINGTKEKLYTSQPAHVFRQFEGPDSEFQTRMWGLLYSNGAVIYTEGAGESYLYCFIDRDLVKILTTPSTPSSDVTS